MQTSVLSKRVCCVIQIAFLVLLQPTVPAYSQGVAGAATLGALLNKLADQVDQIVMDARNSANDVGMEAGREAALAIANARNAYSDSLNETVDKLDPKIKDTTDKLQSLVNDINSGAISTVDLATQRTQQIVNTLPWAHNEPQVTAITPRWVVPSESAPMIIRFQGNFPNSSMSGYEPRLTLDGKTYTSQNTTQQLTFIVPAMYAFHLGAADNAGRLQYAQVTLTVPWQASTAWGLWHERREDHFNLIIGSLPASPGKIELIHTVTQNTPVTQPFLSGPHHQASTREAGNTDDKNHPYLETPDAGWHVVRNTSFLKVYSSQGDQSNTFVSDDGDRVRYNVTTIHHGAGRSGSIDFRIGFTESTIRTSQSPQSEAMNLEWGDSKSFNYPAGTWKIIFTSFDGKHYEMTGATRDNPFLDISNENGSMIVNTKNPATLIWP